MGEQNYVQNVQPDLRIIWTICPSPVVDFQHSDHAQSSSFFHFGNVVLHISNKTGAFIHGGALSLYINAEVFLHVCVCDLLKSISLQKHSHKQWRHLPTVQLKPFKSSVSLLHFFASQIFKHKVWVNAHGSLLISSLFFLQICPPSKPTTLMPDTHKNMVDRLLPLGHLQITSLNNSATCFVHRSPSSRLPHADTSFT